MICKGVGIIIVLMTCDPNPPPVNDVASFCRTYEPTPWRRVLAQVDPDALRVIRRNNAKWNRICRRNQSK